MTTANWLAAILMALLLGCSYLLDDGPSELDAAADVAAQTAQVNADDSAATTRRRLAAQALCAATYGADALFFETQQGHLVCRSTSTHYATGAV